MIKHFAIGKYFNKLYPYLKERYGALEFYTKGQIKKTVEECPFNEKFLPYAYGIFLEKPELVDVLECEYPDVSADRVREYLAKRFFDGNEEYTFRETVRFRVGNEGHDSSGATPGGGGD